MVGEGLAASLARPGGNITGISLLSPELDGKRQDILMEALPGARQIAAMSDSKVTSPKHLQALQRAAKSRGVQLLVFGVSKPDEIAAAIDAAKAAGAEAANFLATPLFSRCQARATFKSLWNELTRCAYHQFSSGLRQRNRVRFLDMVRVLPTFTVSVRKWWRRFFGELSLPIFLSSSLIVMSW